LQRSRQDTFQPEEPIMRDPRNYIDEIRQNLQKMQSQGKVTPAENALFGMVDGLAGLTLTQLERITALEARVRELEGATAAAR
jgi:hypothetical protein